MTLGELADALRAKLKAVAVMRALREIDQELKAARLTSPVPALSSQFGTVVQNRPWIKKLSGSTAESLEEGAVRPQKVFKLHSQEFREQWRCPTLFTWWELSA